MKFTKMHGCGNDYVYMDCTKGLPPAPEQLAVRISDRHFGVGSDGLILIAASDTADFRMIMYNSDGSEAEMCGNGIRCVGKYVFDKGLTDQTRLSIETKCGIKYLKLNTVNGRVSSVQVDMGEPSLSAASLPVIGMGDPVIEKPVTAGDRTFLMTCVSVGNPHAVLWVEDTDTCGLETYGPILERDPIFPQRCNIEFVQIIDGHTIRMRVWERGAGETLACGTGACASAFACYTAGKTGPDVSVQLLGGTLEISYDPTTNHILMTGPAAAVFDGELLTEDIDEAD